MKKILHITLALCAMTALTTLPDVGVGVGVGVGDPYYGGGVGIGLGFGPSIPKGALDSKGRDYWRINNEAPFPITVQSDRKSKRIKPGKRMVKLHRYGDFNFMVMGGGKQNKVGSLDHNLAIGLDQQGNLTIVSGWNQ